MAVCAQRIIVIDLLDNTLSETSVSREDSNQERLVQKSSISFSVDKHLDVK